MRRMITARRMATLATVIMLVVFSVGARGGEGGSKIRWDIQHYPGFVLQPGGRRLPMPSTTPRYGLPVPGPSRPMGPMGMM